MADDRGLNKNRGTQKVDRPQNPFRIGLVCHGNIARSQILGHYLRWALEKRGINSRIYSCGTAPEEAYPNAGELLLEVERGLRDRGMEVTAERTPWTSEAAAALERCDLVLTADSFRRNDVLERTDVDPEKVHLFYDLIGEGAKDFTDTFDPVIGRQDPDRFNRCFDELERIAVRTADRIADLMADRVSTGSEGRPADNIPMQEKKPTDEDKGGLRMTSGNWELKTLTIEERELRYVDEGSGKAVLLIHGKAGDHADWSNQIPVLSKKYRVIAPDLAFFGQSDPSPLPHTVEGHVNDCFALMDYLGIEKAVPVGHSLGGYIIRDMYLADPARVEALVEADTGDAMVPDLWDLPQKLGIRRATGREYHTAINDRRVEEHFRRMEELKQRYPDWNPKAEREPSSQGKWCLVPLLVFYTTRPPLTKDKITQDWIDWIMENSSSENTRLEVFTSGHYLMLEHPDRFNKALLDFLDSLPE